MPVNAAGPQTTGTVGSARTELDTERQDGAFHRVGGVEDPAVADFVGLTDVALRSRREPEQGLYLAEGEKVIRRALEAGHRPRALLLSDRWVQPLSLLIDRVVGAGGRVLVGEPGVLESITGFHVHRGAIASMHRPVLPSVERVLAGARRVLVLEDVVDHTNVGAVFRSAAGIGAQAVLVTPRCADPLYRRAVRVSMGTVFQVPWTRIAPWPEALGRLKESGFVVAALGLSAQACDLDRFVLDLPERLALVLGTEGDGLSGRALCEVDRVVRIPMAGGVDSLNVAAAAAVALWAVRPGA
ncbi:MAG: methyltransferase [Actinomycetota bacterium]|nr:methyltransferase [Actinomycetota bacterium]